MDNTKEPVRLRRRVMPSGNTSLYLDIYRKGKREYEYLHLYLIPERTRADKEKNRETLKLADAIRAKRVVEFRNNEYGFRQGSLENTRFFDYYAAMCEKRFGAGTQGHWGLWDSCLRHLHIYERNDGITFVDITPRWVQGFRDYLDNVARSYRDTTNRGFCERPISQNTKAAYFSRLHSCISQAFRDGIIQRNPVSGISGFKTEEGTRMYLTIEEVERLASTACAYRGVRDAFLFSCLTGLRRSDIEKLTWGEVFQQGEFTRIIFRQKKTKGQEYLDIASQAAELMGERGADDERVFKDIMTSNATNTVLQNWVKAAGICKKITFHCGRHTFATMMLDLGTDIYTVSKLLGHRSLSTTAIYTKVLDKKKQAAVAAIPEILRRDRTL